MSTTVHPAFCSQAGLQTSERVPKDNRIQRILLIERVIQDVGDLITRVGLDLWFRAKAPTKS